MFYLLIVPLIYLAYYYYKRTVPVIDLKRRALLFGLRTITILILLFLVFNPIINFKRKIESPPTALFLVDNSESMNLSHSKDETKGEHLQSITSKLSNLVKSAGYREKEYKFADGLEGAKQNTSLSKTLTDIASRTDLTQVDCMYLISDGWFNDEDLDIVNRLHIPVYTLNPDYRVTDFDIGIRNVIHNHTAYTNEENSFIADLFSDGYTGGVQVKFYIDNKLMDTQNVKFEGTSSQQATFNHTFIHAGLQTFKIEVAAKDEAQSTLGNNSYPGAIRVLENRSGVYILTDNLTWDTRYFSLAFKGDERKEVRTIRLVNGRFFEKRENIDFRSIFEDYLQTVVIVNHGKFSLTKEQVEYLKRFIEAGGGLVTIGMPLPELTELTGVAPSNINKTFRNTITLTKESQQYQTLKGVNTRNIPPVDFLYANAAPYAKVLASIDNDEKSPAIVFQQLSRGKVLSFPFYNLWRWQMRSESGEYNEFIRNIVAWVSNSADKSFSVQTEKNSYFLGENITIRLTAYDEKLAINRNLSPKLSIYSDKNKTVFEDYLVFSGQDYHKQVSGLSTGNYRYTVVDGQTGGSAEGRFLVSEVGLEGRHRGYNTPLLSYISRQTGGEVIAEEKLSDYVVPKGEVRRLIKAYEIPIYRHWLTIALFLLSFTLELFLRRKWGLL